MTREEFVSSLNKIHLEASVIETLLSQFACKSAERNKQILAEVLHKNHEDVPVESINRKWCINQLKVLADEYIDLCREVVADPKLMASNTDMYCFVFQVLLRSISAFIAYDKMELIMIPTAKMMVAADKYLSDNAFGNFMYWFAVLEFPDALFEVAKTPRIQREAMEIIREDEQKHAERKVPRNRVGDA